MNRVYRLAASLIWTVIPFAASCAQAEHPLPSGAAAIPSTQAGSISWQPWSNDLFERARAEHKFVLLDLEAVWCHWCHVQDEITYKDPKVIELINAKYIAVKVDQDSRPDISNRFEDYGWPATVVFNSDGSEIVKRSGYLPPRPTASMLQAIIDDPTPGPSVQPVSKITYTSNPALAPELRKKLTADLDSLYDTEQGGWGKVHKYVDWDRVELALVAGRAGDATQQKRARQTLAAGLKLIDPVWGGVYQYSVEGDWDHPHFEKLMQFQGQMMRIYALGYATFHDPAYLKAATDIRRYMNSFLRSPDGAYLVSQDADLVQGTYADRYFELSDSGRRKQGIPRIDGHQYTRENAIAASGLVALYAWGRDDSALADAKTAARWILEHRGLSGGGFRHDEKDAAGPYLGDTLFAGRAFLDLYEATADRSWLSHAAEAGSFIAARFGSDQSAGIPTLADASAPGRAEVQAEVEENIAAARFFNLLNLYTGDVAYRKQAERAMRLLATPQIIESHRFYVAGILLADQEVSTPALHVTVVGAKSAPEAAALFVGALGAPVAYKRVEWWDPAEGALPNADVEYPKLKTPAAFVCTGNACSSPIREPAALAAKFSR